MMRRGGLGWEGGGGGREGWREGGGGAEQIAYKRRVVMAILIRYLNRKDRGEKAESTSGAWGSRAWLG